MKKDIFKNTKEKMKRFFIKFKNKDTSFLIIALCVCLLSTALIWRYTANRQKNESDLSQTKTEEGNINANVDPLKDSIENYIDNAQEKLEVATENAAQNAAETEKLDLKSMNPPLKGKVIKEFTLDNLVYFDAIGEWRVHKGVDIKSDDTLMVQSAYAGTVEKVSQSELTGTEIVIDHGNNIKTLYNNLSSSKVSVGDAVAKGQEIGNIGKCSSIESSDGPHLHFEMTLDGKNVNPLDYIPVE